MNFQRVCLGCGKLTRDGNRCQDCQRAAARMRQAQRDPQPYSNPEWRKLSAAIRKERPYCQACGVPGNTPGVRLSVDHIMPLSQGGPLLPGRDALRVLCLKCHGKATKHTARWDGC